LRNDFDRLGQLFASLDDTCFSAEVKLE
jgi:hypothetical protein